MSDTLLLRDIDEPGLHTLAVYQQRGGYSALRRALASSPQEVLSDLEASGLRGRGGAGFQIGKKVSFLPHGSMDKYLVCNADESEPGTFKDRELMQKAPHMLIEGIVIAAYAAEAHTSFIYVRGEYVLQADILDAAVAEAREAGYLGEDIRAGRTVLEHKQLRYRRCADPEVAEEASDFGAAETEVPAVQAEEADEDLGIQGSDE